MSPISSSLRRRRLELCRTHRVCWWFCSVTLRHWNQQPLTSWPDRYSVGSAVGTVPPLIQTPLCQAACEALLMKPKVVRGPSLPGGWPRSITSCSVSRQSSPPPSGPLPAPPACQGCRGLPRRLLTCCHRVWTLGLLSQPEDGAPAGTAVFCRWPPRAIALHPDTSHTTPITQGQAENLGCALASAAGMVVPCCSVCSHKFPM